MRRYRAQVKCVSLSFISFSAPLLGAAGRSQDELGNGTVRLPARMLVGGKGVSLDLVTAGVNPKA